MSTSGPLVLPPATGSFRDFGDAIAASWWNGPNGQRYRYAINIVVDAMADGAALAVLARFPDQAPFDAFPWLALDRQIDQGYAESLSHYIGRLKQWLDLWEWAGLPVGILMALLGYVYPIAPEILVVWTYAQTFSLQQPQTTWWTYASGAPEPMPYPNTIPTEPAYLEVQPPNWQWDSVSAPLLYPGGWYRMWVVIFSIGGSPWAAPTATWGGGATWGDGTCWGWSGTATQGASISTLCRKWKAAHCSIPVVIVSYDATMFDSTQAFGSAKLPDGTWGRFGKVANGVYVPARPPSSTCSFLPGAP
jgi:hypothetical protein